MTMAKEKIDEIEKKKQELEAELKRIQHELDDSLDDVRSDVSSRLDPVAIIKNHPLPVVGASLLIGFLAGSHRRRPPRSLDKETKDENGVSSTLWTELKKLATRKAVSLATDYLEKALEKKIEEETGSQNGAPKSS